MGYLGWYLGGFPSRRLMYAYLGLNISTDTTDCHNRIRYYLTGCSILENDECDGQLNELQVLLN